MLEKMEESKTDEAQGSPVPPAMPAAPVPPVRSRRLHHPYVWVVVVVSLGAVVGVLGYSALKKPAVVANKKTQVVVTPTSTATPAAIAGYRAVYALATLPGGGDATKSKSVACEFVDMVKGVSEDQAIGCEAAVTQAPAYTMSSSPSGRYLMRKSNTTIEIARYDKPTEFSMVLKSTTGDKFGSVVWGSDEKELAIVETTTSEKVSVHTVAIDGKGEKKAYTPVEVHGVLYLAGFNSAKHELFSYEVDEGYVANSFSKIDLATSKQLKYDTAEDIGTPVFNSDYTKAYVLMGSLTEIDLASGAKQTLYTPAAGKDEAGKTSGVFALKTQGGQLLFSEISEPSNQVSLKQFNPKTRVVTTVFSDPKFSNMYAAGVSPDGQVVWLQSYASDVAANQGVYYLLNLATKEMKLVHQVKPVAGGDVEQIALLGWIGR